MTPASTIERWTYVGKRLLKGKPVADWRDEAGVGRIYESRKMLAGVVGGIYEIEVERVDSGTGEQVSVVPSSLRYTGSKSDDHVELELEHRAVERHIAADQLERSHKRQSEIDAALEPLLEIAGKPISHAARAALADYVTSRIYAAGRGGRR